jgi:hypothetical protein
MSSGVARKPAGGTGTQSLGEKHRTIIVIVTAAVMIELSGFRSEGEQGRAAAAAIKIEERALFQGVTGLVA